MAESTPVEYKTCSKCGGRKPLSAFGSRGKGRPHRTGCKPCVAKASRDRYQNNPEHRAKHKILRDRWRAKNPTYLREYYQANREKHIAYVTEYQKRNPVDPEKRRQWEREWYAATREQRQAADRTWRENNLDLARELGRRGQDRRRARMRGLPTEPYTMAELVARDGNACVLCDDELDWNAVHPEPLSPTVEHLECIAWPGSAGDVLSNVALSHFSCNTQRNIRPHPAAARKRAELLAALA